MIQTIKPVIAIITICLFITSANGASGDCMILHKGTFKYGDSNTEIIVKIKGNRHVEYHNGGKYRIESKLEWLNECEYNMTMTKVTIPNFPYGPGDIMNVKINKVVGNEVLYTATVKGMSWKGKFIKIE